MRPLLFLFLFVCCLSPAFAQEMLPEADQSQWNAIGRINIAGYKSRTMCTGTLVAPDRVITAAHCLTRADGHWAKAEDIHFLAGYRQGAFVAHRRGAAIIASPPQPPKDAAGLTAIANDIAILVLDTPVPNETISPIALIQSASMVNDVDYKIISYRRDRPHAASIQGECQLVDQEETLVGLSCDVVGGSSGGPVLTNDGQTPQIIAIVSASLRNSGPIRSMAVIVKDKVPQH